METAMKTPNHTVTGITNEKFPGSLKTAQEISAMVKGAISPERLVEFADAGYAPHWRIDGGPPMFQSVEAKAWLANNLAQRFVGLPLPSEVRISYEGPKPESILKVPPRIRMIEGLRDITKYADLSPGIYFLCRDEEVVYVGQSVSPLSRIAQHKNAHGGTGDAEKDFNEVYFLPWPKSDLDGIEGALIRALAPEYNSVRNSPRGVPNQAVREVVEVLDVPQEAKEASGLDQLF